MVEPDRSHMTIGACGLHAGYLSLQTQSEYIILVAFLQLKWLDESTSAPQCYVIRTLPVVYLTAYVQQLTLNINTFGYV